MGYRDDFYIVSNIIGYTGKVNKKPTVYFMTEDEYGRITQDHKNVNNIGRNKVRSREGYTFENEDVDGKVKMVERRNGQKYHTSRNPFVRVDHDKDEMTVALLAQSIKDFTEIKSKS